MCDDRGMKYSYTCPNGTLFHQKFLICAHSYSVVCGNAPRFYPENATNAKRTKDPGTSVVSNNEFPSRSSQAPVAEKQNNGPVKNRGSSQSTVPTVSVLKNRQNAQTLGYVLTEPNFNYSKAKITNNLPVLKTVTARPVSNTRSSAVIRKVNVIKRNGTRSTDRFLKRFQPVRNNNNNQNAQRIVSAQLDDPGTSGPTIIGVSVKSSVQAKTDRIPILILSRPRAERVQSGVQEQNGPNRQGSLERLPVRKDNPVSKSPGTQTSIDRVTPRPPVTAGPYLTREEFFDRIGGLFGRKVVPKVQKNSFDKDKKEESDLGTFDRQSNQTLSRELFVVKLSKNISIDRPVLKVKAERKIASERVVPEQLVDKVKIDPNGTVLDNTASEKPETDDELVTGDYRQCPGCMKYFIQNLDNCFPCVNPR